MYKVYRRTLAAELFYHRRPIMELGSVIIFIVCLVVFALLAYWIVVKFFPEPAKMVALAIVGVICLLALIYKFAPAVMHYKI